MAASAAAPAPLFGVAEPTADFLPFNFDLSPDQVAALSDRVIEHADAVYDAVAAVPLGDVSWDTVAAPLSDLDVDTESAVTNSTFLKDVSSDPAVREAASAAQQKLANWQVGASMRLDVFARIDALAGNPAALAGLSAERQRWVERTLRDKRRLGLHLEEDARKQVEDLKKRISELSIKFQQNLGEVDTKLYFTKEELAGMPEDFLSGLKTSDDHDGKLEVSLGYPHVVPILKLCSVGATRASVETAFNSRCLETNTPLLEETLQLRGQLAAVLGHSTYSGYTLETRMAKNPETVHVFLQDLLAKLKPVGAAELAELQAIKAETSPEPFAFSDFRHFEYVATQRKFDIDMELVKQYFPLATTLDAMFNIYSTVFNLTVTEVPDAPAKWHDEVRLFEVRNAVAGDTQLLGYMYVDLHPRPGKYSHAAVFPMRSSCETRGHRQLPVAALVCNFTKPTETQPSLLTHTETVTLFHEAGHAFHHIASATEMHKFAGFSVEQDFVEAPSQMLENWCWDVDMLRRISSHVKDGSPIPEELAAKLAATKEAFPGLNNLRQVLFATFDQRIHTADGPVDTEALLDELHGSVLGIPRTKGTNFAASFGHMMAGYAAQYYGYLYSEVFSADLFYSQFKKRGLDDAACGLEYRTKVLQPGGSKDAMDLIVDFLGRAPTSDAFFLSKGLAAPPKM